MPASIDGATSCALAAPSERGWPRKPMPSALTKAAAVSPPVSASAATPARSATSVAAPCAAKPWRSDSSKSHSLANPLNPGSALIEKAPIAEQHRGERKATGEPPEPVEVARPGRPLDRTCAEEEAALEDGVIDEMEERSEHREGRERPMPGDREGASRTDADQHEADVVDRRVGEEPLQV